MSNIRKRWATIVVADVVGYSRLIADDARATVTDLQAIIDIIAAEAQHNGGGISDQAGDAVVVTFDTAVGAVLAAGAIQREVAKRAADQAENRKMLLRVGVHQGDILEREEGGVFGDGVNIAARLEQLAPAGGVTVSQDIREGCGNSIQFDFLDQGEFEVKNISDPVRVYLLGHKDGPQELGLEQKLLRHVAKGNMPMRAETLIGRASEMEELKDLLAVSRLVTIFGMGGLGKTSLAIEYARLNAHKYPDGIWFADLAAVEKSSSIGMAIAGEFGITQQTGKTIEECLVEALKGRHMLLVLDNCEHVTKAAANLADAILAHSQKITVIATSRELLSVTGEHVMQIEPLDIDGASSPATQLFLERARAVSPKLSVRDDDISVKAICAELEGIPLAIELAAARAKSMSLEQIHQRLNQRFRLLTGGSKALKRERHHTLHNAVQWSYDLLEDDEKKVFKRISVFAGGFTLEAAEIVSAGDDIDSFDVVDLLDSLVSKSLVVVTRSEDNLRYRMLETIRAYGAEQLEATGDAFDVRAAHATFFSREADANFKVWRSKDQLQAHRWLDAEINNLRSAFTWAMEQDQVDPAARIASSVGDLARFALIEEAANWAELVVEKALSVRHPRSVILLTWSASSAWAASRFEDAQRFGSQALELLQDPHYEPFVWAYGDLAFVAIFSGDVPKAIKLLAEGAGHPVDAHDRMMMTFHLYIMATAGFAEDARLIADDVVRKVDAAGVPMSIAVAHAARGAALEAIDPESALKEYEYGIEVASSSGARFMETLIAPRLASLHVTAGAPQTALEGFERMLLAYGETTDMACVSAWRASLVILLEKTGQFQAAATLHGTLVGLIDQSSVVPAHKEAIDRVMTALGTRGFSSAVESGAAMSMRDAANYAISQVRLGLAVAA